MGERIEGSKQLRISNADIFDKYERKLDTTFDLLSSAATFGATLALAPVILPAYAPGLISGFASGALAELDLTILYSGKGAINALQFGLSKDLYSDLACAVYQLNFKGEKPLKLKNKELKKGDNFLFIRFPDLKIKHPPKEKPVPKGVKARFKNLPPVKRLFGTEDEKPTFSEPTVNLATDLSDSLFQRFKEYLKDMDGELVFIEVRSLPGFFEIPLKDILEGKKIKLKDPGKKVFALTREEFERLAVSLQDLFKKAIEELGNKKVEALVDVARKAGTPQEREEIKKLLLDTLKQILYTEAEGQFNLPEVVLEKVDGVYPRRRKIHNIMQLRVRKDINEDGEFKERGLDAQFFSPKGEVIRKELGELLKNDCSDLERILSGYSPNKRANIAYYLFQLLQIHSLEELIREEKKNEKELLEEIIKEGGVFMSEPGNFYSLVDSKATQLNLLKNLQRRARPFLFSLLVYAAAAPFFSAGAYVRNEIGKIDFSIGGAQLSSNEGVANGAGYQLLDGGVNVDTGVLEVGDSYRSRFPPQRETSLINEAGGGRVGANLDWKITSSDGARQQGYYTLATSHELNTEGAWVINKDVSETKEDFPEEFKSNIPKLTLEKRISLDSDITTTRMPIRDETRLVAVDVNDVLDPAKNIRHKVVFFTDGTVGVEIFKEDNLGWVDIDAILVDDLQNPQVHGAKPLFPLDISKLRNPNLREELSWMSDTYFFPHIESGDMDGNIYESRLRNYVLNRHLYSLDPKGLDGDLKSAKTAEELVNAANAMNVCTCDTCNLEAVLLNSTNPDPHFATNFALGYLHKWGGDSISESSFLTEETYHGFGLRMDGKIADATPFQLAGDELTRNYVNLLAGQASLTPELIKKWDQEMSQIADQEKQGRLMEDVKSGFLIFLYALGFSGAAMGGLYIAGVLRRTLTKDRLENLKEMGLLAFYTASDLQKAYNFYNWVSWSDGSPLTEQVLKAPIYEKSVLSALKKGTNLARVRSYLENSEDGLNNMSLVDRIKMKRLGLYIAGSRASELQKERV